MLGHKHAKLSLVYTIISLYHQPKQKLKIIPIPTTIIPIPTTIINVMDLGVLGGVGILGAQATGVEVKDLMVQLAEDVV